MPRGKTGRWDPRRLPYLSKDGTDSNYKENRQWTELLTLIWRPLPGSLNLKGKGQEETTCSACLRALGLKPVVSAWRCPRLCPQTPENCAVGVWGGGGSAQEGIQIVANVNEVQVL